MHVHDLNPKKTLFVLIAFAVLLVIGFLTMHKPLLKYHLTMKQSLSMLNDKAACFYPWQLVDVLNKKSKNVVLIDIRNSFEYGQGHIPGSENVSIYDLAREENIKRLEAFKNQGLTVVLYGKDQLQANAAWMLFRQVGFDNVKVLLGGYRYYVKHQNNLLATKTDNSYQKGLPRFDFAKVAAKSVATTGRSSSSKKKPVVVRRKKKVAVASGGC